jgi:hydrogenase small subunit
MKSMAITRRQFVTRLGALAAAAGFSQVEASKIMEAMAYDTGSGIGSIYGGTFGKPRVVWLHGAECTGCSTSLLGIFENANGAALYDNNGDTLVLSGVAQTTANALTEAGTFPTTSESPFNTKGGMMLHDAGLSPDPAGAVDIADVVIDVLDILYHETIMGMGGDLAYKWLVDFKNNNTLPFVLVVEGAMQGTGNGTSTGGGAWDDFATVPWCSIAHGNLPADPEITTADIVGQLGSLTNCVAVVAIGQCATFGGYPGCKPPITTAVAGFKTNLSQTQAQGVFDYFSTGLGSSYTNVPPKVVNVPGCPTNPWWFVLSVVALLVDIPSALGQPVGTPGTLGVLESYPSDPGGAGAVGNIGLCRHSAGFDNTHRIKAVYGNPIHGPYCPRYRYFVKGQFASKPGDTGCLELIGCKGPGTLSLCGVHGWNNQQPTNPTAWDYGTSAANLTEGGTATGGHCPRAGHPCMSCTEKGYPDSFVPFVVR